MASQTIPFHRLTLLKMLPLIFGIIISCVYGLSIPAAAPSLPNNGSRLQAAAVTADKGELLRGSSLRIAPPANSLSFRPPAPFLWKPDPEGLAHINFTSYARPITWVAGTSIVYVYMIPEYPGIPSKVLSLRFSHVAKDYVLDRMRHAANPLDRIFCGGGFVWPYGGLTLSIYMNPQALCYNLGLFLNGLKLYADNYAFVEADMVFLLWDTIHARYYPLGVGSLRIE